MEWLGQYVEVEGVMITNGRLESTRDEVYVNLKLCITYPISFNHQKFVINN